MDHPTSTEEKLFEVLKRKALLQNGIGIQIDGFKYTPLPLAQESVYSHLLIDLLSVFDYGLSEFIRLNSLKINKEKLQSLVDLGHIDDNRSKYILWYKEWRNDVAHHFRLIKHHELEQPTNDIQRQLLNWKLISRIWDIRQYYHKISDSHYKIGARAGRIPILIYEINYTEHNNITSNGVKTLIDLSLPEFLKLEANPNATLLPPDPFDQIDLKI